MNTSNAMPHERGADQFAQGEYVHYYVQMPRPGMYHPHVSQHMLYAPPYSPPSGQWKHYNHDQASQSDHRGSSSMDSSRSTQSWRSGDGGSKRTEKSFAGKSAVACMVGLCIQDPSFTKDEQAFQEPVYECLTLEGQHDEDLRKGNAFSGEMVSAKSMLKHAINPQQALEKIEHDVMKQMAQDYEGSKLLQKVLSNNGASVADAVYAILTDDMVNLSIDIYGNYIVQCLIQSKSDTVVKKVGDMVVKKALPLSLNFYGCRVMQTAIKHLPAALVAEICDTIGPFAIHCLQSQNANHVVNAILELPEAKRPPVAAKIHAQICKHALSIATHKYAFKVLQTALGSDIAPQVSKQTVDRIQQALFELSYDEFGNYLLQYMIESNCYDSRDAVIKFITQAPLLTLACHKYGSNVLEKSLLHSTPEQGDSIVLQLLEQCRMAGPIDQVLINVALNKYGNYVVQRILAVATPSTRLLVSSYLRNYSHVLVTSKFGKHIAKHL